jgi:hypothetical protein
MAELCNQLDNLFVYIHQFELCIVGAISDDQLF